MIEILIQWNNFGLRTEKKEEKNLKFFHLEIKIKISTRSFFWDKRTTTTTKEAIFKKPLHLKKAAAWTRREIYVR